MKALLISMGLIFMLGGIRSVSDPRPTVIISAGAQVRPGYSLPNQTGTLSSAKTFGYIAIAAGVASVALGLAAHRIFSNEN